MQFFKLISICCWMCLLLCYCFCCCSCFLGIRRFFFVFSCSSLPLPLRCSYNYYVAIFFLLLFTSFIGKFTSFDFGAHPIQLWILDFVLFQQKKTIRRFTNMLPQSFYPKFVYLISIWFNFKQFSNNNNKKKYGKNCNEQNPPLEFTVFTLSCSS